MRFHIDTIPVWDAYKANAPCPLCAIRQKAEASYVDNFLGGSVMEPDVRIEVNKKGFCRHHLSLLYAKRNSLGLALMLHTHMTQKQKDYDALLENLRRAAGSAGFMDASLAARLAPKAPLATAIGKVGAAMADPGADCVICERLSDTMARYVETLLAMYNAESAFVRAFEDSAGFCLPHFAAVTAAAPGFLRGKKLAAFLSAAAAVQQKQLHQNIQNLHAFTQLFDHQNTTVAPTPKAVNEALPTAMNQCRGECN